MPTSQLLIGIAGMVAASATALLIAYWQRKQMRQIEIYRQNPSAGLLPSPSPFWKFLKSHIDVLGGTLPMIFLIREVFSHEPFTRSSALLIAVDVASLYTLVTLHFMRELWNAVGKLARLHIKHLEDEQLHIKHPEDEQGNSTT